MGTEYGCVRTAGAAAGKRGEENERTCHGHVVIVQRGGNEQLHTERARLPAERKLTAAVEAMDAGGAGKASAPGARRDTRRVQVPPVASNAIVLYS